MKRLRILHIDTERSWRGGERQLMLLAQGQAAAGHTPILVCQPGSVCAERFRSGGLDVRVVSMRGEWDVHAAFKIARIMRDERIDLLHLHTSHAHALGLWATAGSALPVIVHRRVDFSLHSHPLNRLKYGARVARYIAVSEAVARVLEAGGVAPKRVRVIRSAVPEPQVASRNELERLRRSFVKAPEERLIGVVAHLADHKGHSFLLEALPALFERIPKVRVLIVGDGELRDVLERQAGRLNIAHQVDFLGFREDALDITAILDVFVLPSHLEGLGTALLDAMWLERAIVASAAGGIPEVLTASEGWLVPPRSPSALAHAVSEALSDPAQARLRAARARGRVEALFGVARMLEATEETYLQVLDELRTAT